MTYGLRRYDTMSAVFENQKTNAPMSLLLLVLLLLLLLLHVPS